MIVMNEFSEKNLSKNLRKLLTRQDYQMRATIDGVDVCDIPYHADDAGYFLEISRFVNERFKAWQDFAIQQVNYSEMLPGAIKATHLHFAQDDIWFLPPTHHFVVGLCDVRDGSTTEGAIMRITSFGSNGKLIYIPHGVGHGVANSSQHPASMIYFVNKAFSSEPEESDEYRLPWDMFGKDFWEMSRG